MRIHRISTVLRREGSKHSNAGFSSRTCRQFSWQSSRRDVQISSSGETAQNLNLGGQTYTTDSWMNTPPSILSVLDRKLHLQPSHPLAITRSLIESRFPDYKTYNDLWPIVTTQQNFDSLGFPTDHVGRNKTDTYYINKDTLLRTHTSAHQADTFRKNASDGFLISADVYRRDAIDRSHYPVFHQMEGALTWDRNGKSSIDAIIADEVAKIARHETPCADPNPPFEPTRNPRQPCHSPAEVEAMAAHLKRSCEDVAGAILHAAKLSAAAAGDTTALTAPSEDKMRWVEAYFPFTSPSWELEVWWQNDWVEVLGCGIVQQDILRNAGQPNRIGWAFGLGLERIAMMLFGIPDIRLFWSQDPRFLSQFTPYSPGKGVQRFKSFSLHPACYKDVSFWLSSTTSAAGGNSKDVAAQDFHENDVMEIARGVGGDLIEDVRLTDEFVHPKTGRKSMCYRVNYRSLERTLTNEETNELHEKLRSQLVERLGVELR